MKAAVYFDLETGGLKPEHPDIQLAAVAVNEDTWGELGTFETKIAFEKATADPAALEMNHYSDEAWRDAVSPLVAISRFSAFCSRFRSLKLTSKAGRPYSVAKLVGHNAASFDGPRIVRQFERYGMFPPFDFRIRDTMQRALWYFDERGEAPANFKLATLCAHFGIPVEESHEALADVRLCVKLALALRETARAAA